MNDHRHWQLTTAPKAKQLIIRSNVLLQLHWHSRRRQQFTHVTRDRTPGMATALVPRVPEPPQPCMGPTATIRPDTPQLQLGGWSSHCSWFLQKAMHSGVLCTAEPSVQTGMGHLCQQSGQRRLHQARQLISPRMCQLAALSQ